MNIAKILIVDDEKNIQLTLRKALEMFEYEIDDADNGSTACEKIAAKQYDCILLDMRLPDIDGLEILRRLAPQNVIMITAHGTVDNAVEAMKLGCVDFIRKPFDLQTVRDAVRTVLKRKEIAYEQVLEYESLIEAAKLEVSLKHYSRAMEIVNKALESKPESAEAFNFIGVLHEILDDLPRAIKAYHTAQKLDPEYRPASDNLSRLRDPDSKSGIILGLNR